MQAGKTTYLGILAAANILTLFAFQWLLVNLLGANAETDALYAAMVVPNFLMAILGTSLANVLVPILATESSRTFRQSCWELTFAIGGIFTLIASLIAATASFWLPLLLPGFSAEGLELTWQILLLQIPGIIGTALLTVVEAACHARHRFFRVEATRLFSALASLAALNFFIVDCSVYAAAVILAVKPFVTLVVLIPNIGTPSAPRSVHKVLARIWQKLKYLLLGSAYYRTGPLVDRYLLSQSTSGNITLLHIALQLMTAGSTVLNRALVTPLVPRLAKLAHENSWLEFRSLYRRRSALVCLASIAAGALIAFAGQAGIELIFSGGSFSTESATLLWGLLMCLLGVLFGGSLGQVYSQCFYSFGDTRTPTHLGMVVYTAGLIVKILSFSYYGLTGLAIATSVYYLSSTVAMLLCLEWTLTQKISTANTL